MMITIVAEKLSIKIPKLNINHIFETVQQLINFLQQNQTFDIFRQSLNNKEWSGDYWGETNRCQIINWWWWWCSKRRVVNTAVYQLQDDNNSYWFGNQHLLQLSTGHINDTTKFFIVQHVFYRRWFSFQRKETQEMDEGERYKNTNDPARINNWKKIQW